MERLAHLARLFDYDHWANGATLAALRDAPAGETEALRLFAHVLGAGRLWISRLRGHPSPLAVWPSLDLDGCAAELARLREDWATYFAGPPDLDARIVYRNSKGEDWSNTVGDVLLHVLFHGTYHRGQIAARLRAAGTEPAYTDLIEAIRRGYVP